MPRVAIKRKEYKLKDFKGWVVQQMHIRNMTQEELGKVLGISQQRVSVMLAIPKSDKEKREKRINDDPFSYGQVLTLCEFFDTSDEEKIRLLTL